MIFEELEIAADLCEEFGHSWGASALRNFVSLSLQIDCLTKRSHSFIYALMGNFEWSVLRPLISNAIAGLRRASSTEQLLRNRQFDNAANFLAQLFPIYERLFNSCLFNLLEESVISLSQAIESIRLAEVQEILPHEAAVKFRFVTPRAVAIAQSEFHKHEFFDPLETEVPYFLASSVPELTCRLFAVAPIRDDGDAIVFASKFPFNEMHIEQLRFVLDRSVRFVVGYKAAINFVINRLYQDDAGAADPLLVRFFNRNYA